MAVGLYTLKSNIDMRAGQLAQSVRDDLAEAGDFKMWLDTQLDADLEARGCSVGDIATLRSFATDLDKLRRVYLGEVDQTPAYDFRTFAKLLA